MPTIQLPACPAYLSVLAADPEGRMVERATLMAEASDLPQLLSADPNPARERALGSVRRILGLYGTVQLALSATPAPVIAYV